mgnify:CR=1 FL=1
MVEPNDASTESVVATMRSKNGREGFGVQRPGEYTHWIKEQMSWKETCFLGDWSFLANCWLEGPDALELLADISINSFADFDVGGGKHVVQCNEDGKVVADGVLLRHGENAFEIHGVPGYWTAYNLEVGDYDATAEFRDTFNFQVQGPTAIDVIESVTEESVQDIEFIHFGPVHIAGNEVKAVRFGMSGEAGFEIQGPAEYGQAVWDAIFEAGQEHGIRRLSIKTSSINHLEMCFPTRTRDYISAFFGEEMQGFRDWLGQNAGRDLITQPIEGSFDADDISAWYRSPVELGWGHYMKFDHDFTGRAALETEVDDPRQRIVTLEWDDEDVIDVFASLFREGETYKYMDMPYQQKRGMVADAVLDEGDLVGVSTMRGYSYYFRKMLSLCTIDVEYSEPGTEVTVFWGEGGEPVNPTVEPHVQKEISATVAPAPYYTDKRRE